VPSHWITGDSHGDLSLAGAGVPNVTKRNLFAPSSLFKGGTGSGPDYPELYVLLALFCVAARYVCKVFAIELMQLD